MMVQDSSATEDAEFYELSFQHHPTSSSSLCPFRIGIRWNLSTPFAQEDSEDSDDVYDSDLDLENALQEFALHSLAQENASHSVFIPDYHVASFHMVLSLQPDSSVCNPSIYPFLYLTACKSDYPTEK